MDVPEIKWIARARSCVLPSMSLWNDVRFGARTLAKSPGFAVTAIITMGIGIGATTAIFSCSDAMLWKPVLLVPVDNMAMILQRVADDPSGFS